LARYNFVHSLFDGVFNQNSAQKTLTVNLINLALDNDEATRLFAGLSASTDSNAKTIGELGNSISSLQGTSVLWVDDNPDGNSYPRSVPEQLGVRFTNPKSTYEALPLLRERTFQLVITDLRREADKNAGFTLLDEVRQIQPSTPVIIYTRFVDDASIATANELKVFMTNRPEELLNQAIETLQRRQ
jgi:CheY-like chemotaxis protein